MRVPESNYDARWWHRLDDGRMQCDLCPRDCRLHEGQRGLCFVRQREGDAMVLDHLRALVGLLHRPDREEAAQSLPSRHAVLSFGTAGCNLACKFCQNWDISKSREMDTPDGRGVTRTRSRAAAERARLPQRRVHLQRSGDLRRVRDGRRRRVPCARHADRRGDRRLHLRRAARASSTRTWTPPTSTSRRSPRSSTVKV